MSEIHPRGVPFFFPGDSGIGCLLIHGFTSTPQEMRGLGEHLAARGHSVIGVRLAGHATRPSAMTVGMGGALAMLLSASKPLEGVVAMATPFEVPPIPWLRFVRPLLPPLRLLSSVLRYLPKPPPWGYKDRQAAREHLSYRIFPTRGVLELDQLLQELANLLPGLTLPVLMMHAHEDRGVLPKNADMIFARLGSQAKELVWIKGSGHVITVEPAHQQVFERINAFVEQVRER
jgi:carboxylesterase